MTVTVIICGCDVCSQTIRAMYLGASKSGVTVSMMFASSLTFWPDTGALQFWADESTNKLVGRFGGAVLPAFFNSTGENDLIGAPF